ncbi:unnamed protein product, partial [Sphacelaria rigidula]
CGVLWAQCGGITWDGPTCCLGSLECTRINDYYYQCTS